MVSMAVQDGRQQGMVAYLVSGTAWYTNNKAHFHRRKPVWFPVLTVAIITDKLTPRGHRGDTDRPAVITRSGLEPPPPPPPHHQIRLRQLLYFLYWNKETEPICVWKLLLSK
jgi:hypothetical protein